MKNKPLVFFLIITGAANICFVVWLIFFYHALPAPVDPNKKYEAKIDSLLTANRLIKADIFRYQSQLKKTEAHNDSLKTVYEQIQNKIPAARHYRRASIDELDSFWTNGH